jgi:hypothetical protein
MTSVEPRWVQLALAAVEPRVGAVEPGVVAVSLWYQLRLVSVKLSKGNIVCVAAVAHERSYARLQFRQRLSFDLCKSSHSFKCEILKICNNVIFGRARKFLVQTFKRHLSSCKCTLG